MNWRSANIVDDFRYVRVKWPTFAEAEELANITGGSLEDNYLTSIKSTASIDYVDGLDIGADLIRVYYEATDDDGGSASIALGTFFVSTPKSTINDKTTSGTASCYSVLSAVDGDEAQAVYSLPAGTVCVSKAIEILQGCGMRVSAGASSSVLASAATWKAGTSKLEIVNDLLEAATYCSALVDGYGTVVLKPYVNPADMSPRISMRDDEKNLFLADFDYEYDTYSVANVVVVTYESDDMSLSATARNDDPKSPLSTVSRGRTVVRSEQLTDISIPDGTSDADKKTIIQAALQTKADTLILTESSVVESVKFTHVFLPYDLQDAVAIDYVSAGLKTTMSCIKRSIKFDHGAPCSPRLRRFIQGFGE